MARMEFDLLVRNATIHDGIRFAGQGSVGVTAGRIVACGAEVAGTARRSIDAGGRTLAPGFIDIHSHADVALLRDPLQHPKVLQGVTTEVFTSCGLGCAPQPVPAFESLLGRPPVVWSTTAEYLAHLRPSVNVGYLVAHGPIRHAVMGMAERPATADEVDQMKELAVGGIGFSTGLYYSPMKFAAIEETVALAKAAGGFTAIHIRDFARGLWDALDEAIAICEQSGVPMQISHLQAIRQNAGRAGEIIARIEKARARGLDITGDVYPYTAGSTMLSAVKEEEYDEVPWDRAFLCRDGSLIGTAARARELRDAGTYLVHQTTEADVETFVKWQHAMIGSDGLHVGERPHPRLWGTFPRVLSKWGMEMLPKMTSKPAARLGLEDRGVIKVGAAADLVLMSSPRDVATFDDPARPPEGIHLVVVNGAIVVEEGRHTGATPGRVLT